MTFIPVDGPFDLRATFMSGQAFRWREDAPWFVGVIFDNVVKVRQTAGGIEFQSAPDDESSMAPMLRDYFHLDTDLDAVYASISIDDRVAEAIERHRGMRVLRQDPWETLMCFICATASNIPRITKNVEDLCEIFGRPVRLDGHVRYTYPKPNDLAEADEEAIRGIRLGYRAAYLVSTARAVAEGKVDLMSLREDSYEEALESLVTLDGVGDKVANCVTLFSLDKLQAFPVDTWIIKILRDWYLKGNRKKLSPKNMRIWAVDHFGPYAGYANHYLFHDRRLTARGR